MRSPLILDGAMGTELKNRGIDISLPIWSADANLEHPEVVVKIHSDYISAGADIITANTFRTTTWTYRRAGYTPIKAKERARDSLLKAVECAQNASNKTVQIAGSITSVEDCYSPEKFPGKTVAEDTYGETLEISLVSSSLLPMLWIQRFAQFYSMHFGHTQLLLINYLWPAPLLLLVCNLPADRSML
jgi:methionine synthase I (cobalamin-dependent)